MKALGPIWQEENGESEYPHEIRLHFDCGDEEPIDITREQAKTLIVDLSKWVGLPELRPSGMILWPGEDETVKKADLEEMMRQLRQPNNGLLSPEEASKA